MSEMFLNLTPHDQLIARDGRPFGFQQGQRMRGMPWPLPSVVAGSFRSALVKASPKLDFAGDMPVRLQQIEIAGMFPIHDGALYLPAPNDAVAEPIRGGPAIKTIHRATPQDKPQDGGCDFPTDLRPVMLPDGIDDFKPADVPAWWPVSKHAEWLTTSLLQLSPSWFTGNFLKAAQQSIRDHVCLDPARGAAAESMLFATTGLDMTHLPRFGVAHTEKKEPLNNRFAEISLSARVRLAGSDFRHVGQLNIWHPLGGERRLVHWYHNGNAKLWACPIAVKQALDDATHIRMVLATPAIFKDGWKPGWLNDQLEGSPPGTKVKLKLVGVNNSRWKAVSGWSFAPPRGPKATRRMVPAGSVYFFECKPREAAPLADHWLESVSDAGQEQRDGFGLAVWGTW